MRETRITYGETVWHTSPCYLVNIHKFTITISRPLQMFISSSTKKRKADGIRKKIELGVIF